MAATSVNATYKNKEGTLTLSSDQRLISWTASQPAGAPAPLRLASADIQNLQQTPASNPKVSIRIVAQPQGAAAPENYVFKFASKTARADQENITNALRSAITTVRASSSTPLPKAGEGSGGGQSAAMAIAAAVTAGVQSSELAPDDDMALIRNTELQRSLLESNEALRARFFSSLKGKPESMSATAHRENFWATRVNLLRIHAAEKAQKAGDYNVFTEIRFSNDDEGNMRITLSQEQIALLFSQHAVVRKAYDELVPKKLSETEFWKGFFRSRLIQKLKGQKIDAERNIILDKYLDFDRPEPAEDTSVPRFDDLEGNEQNHSQRKGNAPDFTMRSDTGERLATLRALNTISERLMAKVHTVDSANTDLELHDLELARPDDRIILNLKDQKRFFVGSQDKTVSHETELYAKQDPMTVVSKLKNSLRDKSTIAEQIGIDDDSASSSDEEPAQKQRRKGRQAAMQQIMSAIRRQHADDTTPTAASFGLSEEVYSSVQMTNSTTAEFIKYFWSAFLSGDADKAAEIKSLVENLTNALDRIKAVATEAETERKALVDDAKRKVADYEKRTGKRRRFDPSSIKGGEEAVTSLLSSTVRAITAAAGEYKKALDEQTRELAAGNAQSQAVAT